LSSNFSTNTPEIPLNTHTLPYTLNASIHKIFKTQSQSEKKTLKSESLKDI
jgi:hypothetical protein